MSTVRWSRAIWLGIAIFVIAIGAALLPLAWYAYGEYAAARVSPVIASSEFNDILLAVLNQTELDGMPPPPPRPALPGEPANPLEPDLKPLLLADATLTVCGEQEPRNTSCSHLADADFWPPGFPPDIPLQLRKELVAANRSPIAVQCPSSKKVKCGLTESILMAPRRGQWREFYALFPETAGVMRISNAVLTHDRTGALIYLEFGCGQMCASGRLVLLRKKGSGWLVERQERLWES